MRIEYVTSNPQDNNTARQASAVHAFQVRHSTALFRFGTEKTTRSQRKPTFLKLKVLPNQTLQEDIN